MARHRTSLTPQERRQSLLRWAGRVAVWLALGAIVGVAAWGAMAWAGSPPGIRPWVGLVVGVLAAAAAGIASTVPGPEAPDEPTDGPPSS
ncbi:MAG TPA: hypothetical protein VGC04_01235 [Cellulomonas sp.]